MGAQAASEKPIMKECRDIPVVLELDWRLGNCARFSERLRHGLRFLQVSVYDETGFYLPPVKLLHSMMTDENQYLIRVRWQIVDANYVYPDHYRLGKGRFLRYLDERPDTVAPMYSYKTYDDGDTGATALWFREPDLPEPLWHCGQDANAYLYSRLEQAVYTYFSAIITYMDVKEYYARVRAMAPGLVEQHIDPYLTPLAVKSILGALLERGFSIHEIQYVFELIAAEASSGKSPGQIAAGVAAHLGGMKRRKKEIPDLMIRV